MRELTDNSVFRVKAKDYVQHAYKLHKNMFILIGKSTRIKAGSIVLAFFLFMAIFAPFISPYDPFEVHPENQYLPPSFSHLVGTDREGRDVLSRLIWGTRYSLYIAVISVIIGLILGGSLGLIAGYLGGITDLVIGRIVDVFSCLPSFVLAIVVSAALGTALGSGLFTLMAAIGISLFPGIQRVVRGVVMTVKENEFVEVARSFALSKWSILLRHIIPHCSSIVVTYAMVSLGTAILLESALNFLGLGLPPPTPTLGYIIRVGGQVLREHPWISTVAGLFIATLIVGFNLLSDGLRDLLDPRLRRGIEQIG